MCNAIINARTRTNKDDFVNVHLSSLPSGTFTIELPRGEQKLPCDIPEPSCDMMGPFWNVVELPRGEPEPSCDMMGPFWVELPCCIPKLPCDIVGADMDSSRGVWNWFFEDKNALCTPSKKEIRNHN